MNSVDVIGSYAQDTPPYFPIPYRLVSKIPSFAAQVPASPIHRDISGKLYERYGCRGSELDSIFNDFDAITALFSSENARSAGRIWYDSIVAYAWIDPLAHRLLSTAPSLIQSPPDDEEEETIVFETSRFWPPCSTWLNSGVALGLALSVLSASPPN